MKMCVGKMAKLGKLRAAETWRSSKSSELKESSHVRCFGSMELPALCLQEAGCKINWETWAL